MSKKYFTEIKVKRPNFLGDGEWELADLNVVNVIFGKNGSGKSQILRKIREKNQDYFYASPERAGDISFDVNIMNTQMTERGRAKSRNSNLATNYRQEAVSRIHVMYMTIADAVTRGEEVPKLEEAEDLLNTLLPDFSFKMVPKSPPYVLTRVSDEQPVTSSTNLSSGEAEVLSLAMDLLTTAVIWQVSKQDQRVLLIDEPDTHLHPDLQVSLAQFLIALSRMFNCQLLISTHSTTLLSALGYAGGDDVSVLFFKNLKAPQKFCKFGPELSTLSACLGGHALMGPVFGAPITLVEGDDDYRLWTHVSRGEVIKKGFAVLPCNGDQIKDYQKSLERIFGSLRSSTEPCGFVILDGDKGVPTHTDQAHVKYLQLKCHEAENLFLTDEVLAKLGFTWDSAKKKLVEEASNYGSKKDLIIKACELDRKDGDFKTVINEIAQILDEKNIFWPVRVGKILGKEKPVGQLAHFLGAEVVSLFWT